MSSAFGGVNLRQQERKLMRVPAVLTMPDGSSFESRTLNISDAGMGLVCSANPRDGTQVTVSFRLPTAMAGSPPLRLTAEVRNSVLSGADSGFRLGLQFVNLPAGVHATLKAFAR